MQEVEEGDCCARTRPFAGELRNALDSKRRAPPAGLSAQSICRQGAHTMTGERRLSSEQCNALARHLQRMRRQVLDELA
jgi:hypothetical protein